jgi:type IV pilus assembly protein PilV
VLVKPRTASSRSAQQGALLIEVLVAIVICAFGLLGFAALQARATTTEFESYQRSQALVLISDMTNRLNANRAAAASYVVDGLIGGSTAVEDCTGKVGAPLDLCEWGNLIRGSAESRGGSRVGSMIEARGCIERAAGTTDRYVVSVLWQGVVPSGAPPMTPCNAGTVLTDARLRRVVSTTICMARLRDPEVAPVTPRC